MESSIDTVREAYRQRQEEIGRRFFRSGNAAEALEELTENLDQTLQEVSNAQGNGNRFAMLAIGGYGRRELFPHSDVDLLFLHPARQQREAEKAITAILHRLWDLGLHLGQQVCSIEELSRLKVADFEFVLALLDARFLLGDRDLADRFLTEIFPKFLRRKRKPLVERIEALTLERHQDFRHTIYQLEPDLKQAPGGLRDYLAGRWLVRLGSAKESSIYPDDQVETALRFIQKLRLILHFKTGRNQNQLTHRLQEEVCAAVGYRETSARFGVESLMKEYFLNARMLYGYCRRSLSALQPRNESQEIRLEEGRRLSSLADALELFVQSRWTNRTLSEATRRAIVEALPLLSESLDFPSQRGTLLEILKPGPGLYRTLSEMYEVGILELLLPEFGSIKARVIRDFYHRYTVDEHTLLAIRNIEELLTSAERSDLRFRDLLGEVERAEMLVVALLLHDVGKGREGKHTTESARMAAKAMRRFRFPKSEIDLVTFLIRNHLAMSSVIFRRDLEDPEEIGRFTDLISDTERLKMLCLLTFADIKAVGPGTLNEWKKDLLWQLYVGAYRKLTVDFGEERIQEEDRVERLAAQLPQGLDREGFVAFVKGFPKRYLTTVGPREVFEHYRLASRLDGEHSIQFSLTDQGKYYDLCVVTPDRRFLFAKIVGLLSYFDMNILRGHGFSNRQSTVLDVFRFSDTRGVFRLNPEEKERFRQLLVGAVRDEISVEKLLAGKEQSVVFRSRTPDFAPTIYFEDEHSERYTIMEIVAPDSVGLLSRIGNQIAGLECDIELVLISTEGNKAVDVFYLTRRGGKLSPEIREELSKRIVEAIG